MTKDYSNARNKNWNIFAGELEYKSDFILRFKKSYTLERYKNDQFIRLHFFIKSYFMSEVLCWLLIGLYYFNEVSKINEISGFFFILGSYYMAKHMKNRFYARICQLLFEFAYQIHLNTLFAKSEINMGLYIAVFNIPTLISDLLFSYVWYQHLLYSTILFGMDFILFRKQTHAKMQICAIMLTTITFGFCERFSKENWVLYDSFKRAQNLFMKMADKFPISNFIVDVSGRMQHLNASAKQLFEKAKRCKIAFTSMNANLGKTRSHVKEDRGIFDMVHPDFRKTVDELIKKAVRQKVDSLEIPLLTNLPSQYANSECNLGLDINFVNQGIFKIFIEKDMNIIKLVLRKLHGNLQIAC